MKSEPVLELLRALEHVKRRLVFIHMEDCEESIVENRRCTCGVVDVLDAMDALVRTEVANTPL